MLNGSEEAHYGPYQNKIFGFLHVPHLNIGFVNNNLVYSGFNVDLPLDPKGWPQAMKTKPSVGTYVDLKRPEVLIIHRDSAENYLQTQWSARPPAIGSISGYSPQIHNPIIKYNGTSYILDSCILGAELHTQSCSIGHAIAGVTCNNERRIYNGWTARSADKAMKGAGSVVSDMPCALMKADWQKDKSFCINSQACRMNVSRPNQIGKELCFNAVQRSTVIYIRMDIAKKAGYQTIGKMIKK
jgi:hypothetical protein